MKKRYQSTNKFNVQHRSSKKTWIAVLVVILLIIAGLIRGPLSDTVFSVFKGNTTTFSSTGAVSEATDQILSSKKKIFEENTVLKQRIQELELKMLNYDVIAEENERLRLLLGRNPVVEEGLVSRVLVRPSESPFDLLVIDAGFQSGIEVGHAVYANGDVLIGEVTDVYSRTATVRLFSSPGDTHSVTVGGNPATAIGLGGGNFEIELPRALDISEGEPVILSQDPYHALGVVERIELNDVESFQKVYAALPVNFFLLPEVVVREFTYTIDPNVFDEDEEVVIEEPEED